MLEVLHYCQILASIGAVRSSMLRTRSPSASTPDTRAAAISQVLIVCVPLGLFNHLTIYQFNTAKRSILKFYGFVLQFTSF